MELRHLRYALAVAEHGQFSRAARALGIAQSPLSRQVAALEAELGVRLFARTPRGAVPTPAGEVYLTRARRVLADLELAARDARATAAGGAGVLRLGVIGSALVSPLPTLLGLLRARRPDVRIECRELSSRASSDALRAGDLDVALCRGAPTRPGAEALTTRPVATDHVVLLCHRAHPFACAPSVTVDQLAGERLVIATAQEEPAVLDTLADLLADRDPSSLTRARDMATIAGLVACGLGVAPLPSSVRALGRPGTHVVDLLPTRRLPDLHVVHRTGDDAPLVAAFLAVVAEATGRRAPDP